MYAIQKCCKFQTMRYLKTCKFFKPPGTSWRNQLVYIYIVKKMNNIPNKIYKFEYLNVILHYKEMMT